MYCSSCGHKNADGVRYCVQCGSLLGGDSGGDAEYLGPYELRGELGRGAMARVWRAWDSHLRREVAIKEPLFDTRLSQDVLDEMGRRFVAEGVAAARLNHPNIVTIHSADVYDGRPAIVMELVEGSTLADLLEAGPLDPSAALDALYQLLAAASYAHSMGVVHRDIKPDNVFVGRDGRVRLADFGIARMEDAGTTMATMTGVMLGTPGYMSPEQIRGDVVDARSDLFSIGVVAYEMLTGRNPFGAGEGVDVTTLMYRVVNEPVDELPEPATEGLPASVAPAIMAALAKDPADRPQTADEFAAMLRGDESLPTISSEKLASAVEADANRSGAPKWLPYVLVGVVGVVAIVLVLLNGMSSSGRTVGPASAPASGANSSATSSAAPSTSSASSSSAATQSSSSSKPIADNEASKREQESSQASNAPSSFPHKWTGTYLGRSTRTASGTADRNVDMEFTNVMSDGKVEGVCYVGNDQEGFSHCSYNIAGSIDWDTGAIAVEGTSWIDHGNMETWGGFKGTINMSDWVIDGEWYAPASPEAGTSPWSMAAGTRRIASQHVSNSDNAGDNNVSANNPPESKTSSDTGSEPSAYSQSTLIPLSWTGTYEGVSHRTDSGTADRKVELELDPVVGNTVTGVCYVGRGQEGYSYCAYRVAGEYNKDTGNITLEGTEWVDKGNMEGWGAFVGTVYSGWTISGTWYDPTGEYSHRGAWHMSANI